jgi:DNA-binding transcriptional regulator PaaX
MAAVNSAAGSSAMVRYSVLPSELLPGAWIGVRARAVFAQCWIELCAMTDETVPQLFASYAAATRPHG